MEERSCAVRGATRASEGIGLCVADCGSGESGLTYLHPQLLFFMKPGVNHPSPRRSIPVS